MIAVALLAALALSAQDTEIDADRPHVGTGAHVVAPQEVQVELGVQLQDAPEGRTFGSPTLVRIGVANGLELRVATDGVLIRQGTFGNVYGVGNAQLGAKIRLAGDQDEPFLSVMPMVNFGLASREKGFGSGATDLSLTWLAGHSIGARLHVEGNYGFGAIGDPDGHFGQHLLTGAVVHQTTRRVQTYIETAWWSRQQRDASAFSFVDYGFIAAITPRLLVDAGAFTGVTSATPGWGAFSGLSFTFGGRHLHEQLRRGARADRQRTIVSTQHH